MTYILVTFDPKQRLENGLMQNGLLQWLQNRLRLYGSDRTAVTAELSHKEKLISEAILVVIQPNFDSSFSKPDRFCGGH